MTVRASDPAEEAGEVAVPSAQDSRDARLTTAAQLRRFIKSRPYVPMHELRRRFELNGQPDDVFPIHLPEGIVYIGLPAHECELLGGLVRSGEVGIELCRDPHTPMAVGVYPMRPVVRQ